MPFHLGEGSVEDIFKNFNPAPKGTLSAYKYNSVKKFSNYGICFNREYQTYDIKPAYKGIKKVLRDIIIDEEKINEDFYVSDNDIEKWKNISLEENFNENLNLDLNIVLRLVK